MAVPSDIGALVGFQKAEFNHCAKLRSKVLKLQTAAIVFSVISVFMQYATVLYAMAVLMLLVSSYYFYLNHRLSESRMHAEKLRRSTMIIGGLDVKLSGAEMVELRQGGHASLQEAQRLADTDYFASEKPPGSERLVDMLEESAIWTANLSRFAAQESWVFFILVLVSLATVLLTAILFVTPSEWQIGARMVIAVLLGLLTADFLGAATSYSTTQRTAYRVIDRLQKYKGGNANLEQVLLVFGDYNHAVEAMPPFPHGLYDRHEKRLNEDYRLFLTGPQ